MAAPAPVLRGVPAGIKLEDGFRSLLAFGRYPTLAIFEIDVGSPGLDGGEPIPTVTQHNVEWRTMALRQLKTMTAFDVTYAYDPKVYTTFKDMINVEDTITRLFPDGSTLSFYGGLLRINKDPNTEGVFPTGTMTVQPTNWDYINDVEAGPLVVEVAGT